ncbi:CHAT domain-containing protein [Micromonospora sp. NPDC049257]|uniref:CHAT domain-containing protein n=1 Tax=Micromonospora sp. NPDC049257 TaxID=3155771 RepID=UPI00342F9934
MAGIVGPGGLTPGEPSTAPAARPAESGGDAGAVASPTVVLLERPRGPMPARLPAGTALLRVAYRIDHGEECFHLELHTDDDLQITVTEPDLRAQRRPELSLARAAAEGRWLQFLLRLTSWSENKTTLETWLTALRRRYEDRLRLIIWDETGFEIPWELFAHRAGLPGEHGWLGADVEIVRWTSPLSETAIDWWGTDAAECHGPVLSFVDSGLPMTLNGLFERWSCEDSKTMDALLTSLAEDGRGVGLVHVWTHGTVGDTGDRATLGGLSRDRIGAYRMGALRAGRTLVLLNACSGAQLMGDTDFGERASRSFALIFLRRGAPGVIATAGQVEPAFSRDLLEHLLTVAAVGEVRLSAALRDYRARLAAGVGDLTRAGTDLYPLRAFIYGVMYQYIGRLDTTLRLQPRGEPG